jgi:hypothetical protein
MYMKRRPSSTVAITKEDAAGAEWPSLFCQASELAHAKADALEAQRVCLEWALGSGEGAPLGKHAAAVRRQGGTAEATLLAAPRFVNYTAKGQGVRMHADDNGHGWAVVLVLGDWSGGGDLVMAAKRGNVAIAPNSVVSSTSLNVVARNLSPPTVRAPREGLRARRVQAQGERQLQVLAGHLPVECVACVCV